MTNHQPPSPNWVEPAAAIYEYVKADAEARRRQEEIGYRLRADLTAEQLRQMEQTQQY